MAGDGSGTGPGTGAGDGSGGGNPPANPSPVDPSVPPGGNPPDWWGYTQGVPVYDVVTGNPNGYNAILADLQGPQRDAAQALSDLFASYGLGSLTNAIVGYIQQGMSPETISVNLQQTDEYRLRFAGNETRKANGLPVLSPADYMNVEAAYRQIMSSAGLPAGFYDSHNAFADFIGNDISPVEMKSRVDMAVLSSTNAPPEFVNALGVLGIDTGATTAHFLDDSVALPILQQQVNAAQIGASALRQGLAMDADRATVFANMGINPAQANAAYQRISYMLPTMEQLGTIYGQDYSQTTAEDELLGGSGDAQMRRQKLLTQEAGTFSGSTAVGEKSLVIPTSGKF